jgi:uncharacterized membrane protein
LVWLVSSLFFFISLSFFFIFFYFIFVNIVCGSPHSNRQKILAANNKSQYQHKRFVQNKKKKEKRSEQSEQSQV